MFAFSLTIFWGACLLFLVQPLIARFILPWFGGGPAVWTTCMLFFQVLLLGGYAYAHFSISRLRPRRQVIVHLCLLALAVALLPITPGDQWKPTADGHPAVQILLLLLACLGLPYLVLSATGPLLQAWFSQAHPGISPYRLYALSNIGSLLALVAYPFVVEPNLARNLQAGWWSAGLVIYAGLAGWCGWIVWQRSAATIQETIATAAAPRRGWADRVLWFALPACGVVLLLAITNKLCQDIAVVPFLWVLPLGLYLLTFIISFDSPRWYHRGVWLPLLGGLLGTVLWNLQVAESHPEVSLLTLLYLSTLFVACMVCHGETYRLRPAAQQLTGFYLSISAGGAAGGLFVAIGGPLLFVNYFELHLGLFMIVVLTLAVLGLDRTFRCNQGRLRWVWLLPLIGLPFYAWSLWDVADASLRGAVSMSRNFYGVLKVTAEAPLTPELHQLTLQHGATIHGLQYVAEPRRREPTSYYTSTSGIGRLMRSHMPTGGRKVAAVGLGTGTLAAWGRTGDTFRFYEINDEVARLAKKTFTYLGDSQAKIELVMGDARLSMEREAPQAYDVIILDAFSSDAIPVHLLTLEAFEHYRRHLKPDGAIVVHVSNRYLDLRPIVARIAEHIKYTALDIDDGQSFEDDSAYPSDWIILTRNMGLTQSPLLKDAASELATAPNIPAWTDERSDLMRILITEEGTFLHWWQGR